MMEVKLKLIGDCKRALEEAQERSRKFGEGSERMSGETRTMRSGEILMFPVDRYCWQGTEIIRETRVGCCRN